MSEPGLTTPLQPVRRERGLGPVAVGLALAVVLGVIVWRPWSTASRQPDGRDGGSSSVLIGGPASHEPATPRPNASFDPLASSELFAGPTTGPWSGRVAGEWSIVAFLRTDPGFSRESLTLRQQPVAVFVGPPPPHTDPNFFCDAAGAFSRQTAADLPTRAVHFLGIAFPPDRQVYVDGVYRLGGTSLGARPVELGRISGDPVATPNPAASVPAPSPNRADEPVRMFALPDGGAWPDGVYRFDVFTRDGLPGQMFACIRP